MPFKDKRIVSIIYKLPNFVAIRKHLICANILSIYVRFVIHVNYLETRLAQSQYLDSQRTLPCGEFKLIYTFLKVRYA